MVLAGFVSAYGSSIEDVGIGYTEGSSEGTSPHTIYLPSTSYSAYFQMPYAGNNSIYLNISYTGRYGYYHIYGLNYTSGSAVWTDCGGVYNNRADGSLVYASFDLTCFSNVGVYGLLNSWGNDQVTTIYLSESSYELNCDPDYSTHSYVAGSSYTFPLLNRYYPQNTLMSIPGVYASPVHATNSSAFYYAEFRTECDATPGVQDLAVLDVDTSTYDFSLYYVSANISAPQDLNITAYSDAPGNILIAPGVAKNFSIVVNHPEAVTSVSWFINSGMVSSGTSYIYQFNESASGTYVLEVYVDDETCGRTLHASWTITVGQTVSISGTVHGRSSSGVTFPLPEASIVIYCDSSSYLNGTTSNSTGGYSFSGLPAGTYEISVGKDYYDSQSETITLNASSSANTPYRKDFILQHEELWGDWYVQVLDSSTNRPITGYNYSLYWGGLLVLQIQNNAVTYQRYSNMFNASGDIAGNGEVYVTGIPVGSNYTVRVSKAGYASASSASTTVSATNEITEMSPSWADDLYMRQSSLPSTNQSVVMYLTPDWTNVTDGEFQHIGAIYYASSVPIADASCMYSSTGTYPSSGTLESDGSGGYSAFVQVSGSGTSSYNVTCSKVGYDTRTLTDTFYIHAAGDIATKIIWLGYSTPVMAGYMGTYRIWYGTTNEVPVGGAACILKVNGTEYVMQEDVGDSSGYYTIHEGYSKSVLFSSAGAYSVYVTCSRTGYLNASSDTQTIMVYSGSTPTTIPNHCADRVKNYDESDVDCGGSCTPCGEYKRCGSNADCLSNYCSSGTCRSPSCYDNVRNGDESGTDCGGSCYPCACFKNSDCSQTGSEHCQDYQCVRDNCTTSCTSITWSSPTNPVYDRARYCVNGLCSFTVPAGTNISGNITTSELAIDVAPLGPYYAWNNSGTIFYVSNCEDATNGFTVASSKSTQKSYFHVDSSVYPSVPASTSAETFSSEYSLTYSGRIPKLCEIPVGSENVSSLIVFYLNEGTSGFKTSSVYALTFREKFKLNATYEKAAGLVITTTRPATCKYRTSTTDAWTEINTVEDNPVYVENASMGYKYQIYCNNSYGESASGSYGKGSVAYSFVSKIAWAAGVFLGEFWLGFFGMEFADWWRPEYILLIAAGVFILFPATVAFLIFAVMNKKKPVNQYKGKA